MQTDIIVFGGVNFIRYPESKVVSDTRYYKGRWRINGKLMKTYLHRVMWMEANGPIPAGHHIHHKDENYLNNTLENFECITSSKHLSDHYHSKSAQWKAAKTATLINVAQEAAKEWHKSEEGREWHSKHMQEAWAARVALPKICTVCGKQYESTDARSGHLKYCSPKCNAQARRLSGLDDITRLCLGCGKDFVINKYARSRSCSRACAGLARRMKRLSPLAASGPPAA